MPLGAKIKFPFFNYLTFVNQCRDTGIYDAGIVPINKFRNPSDAGINQQ